MNPYNKNKSKAISSYLLEGFNINKILQEELHQSIQPNHLKAIKINRRPVFRLQPKDKENAQATISSNPNHSFKIRSFTRKVRDIHASKMDQSEIFQKVQYIRNCRNNNSNRMQMIMRISSLSKEQKELKEQLKNVHNKMQIKVKQIIPRDSSIKCKVSHQIFIKEISNKFQFNKPTVQFNKVSLSKFKDIAYKINVHFNTQYDRQSEVQDKSIKTLLIISVESLILSYKKPLKASIYNYLQQITQNNKEIVKNQKVLLNNEQVQLLKMLSIKHYSKDKILQEVKIAYKVNNSSEMCQLRSILQQHQINDYFCIFYPIKKYIQSIGVYSIDPLLENIQNLIILESKYKLQAQLPILTEQINTLFMQTYFDNLLILSRTISAIKYILYNKIKERQPVDNQFYVRSIETQESVPENQDQKQIQVGLKSDVRHQGERLYDIGQFCIKDQLIKIDLSQFNAKLELHHQNRIRKGDFRNKKRSLFNESQVGGTQRKILGQRQQNIPVTSQYSPFCQNSSKLGQHLKISQTKVNSIEQIKQNLLQHFKDTDDCPFSYEKSQRKVQFTDKADELQDITNNIKGLNSKSKTIRQLIFELTKKNTLISKQINQYITNAYISTQEDKKSQHCSVSYFQEPQNEVKNMQKHKVYASSHKYGQVSSQVREEFLEIAAYKVY